MFVVIYFLFLIGVCVLTVLVTIVVLRMNLHADSKPLVEMPAWVSNKSTTVHDKSNMWSFGFKDIFT